MNVPFHNKLVVLLVAIALLAMPMIGVAQDAFSSAPSGAEMAQNATDTANAVSTLIQAIVCLVGFILVCMGLYGLYRVNKEKGQGQASIGGSLTAVVIGMLMVMLPLTIGTVGKSLFGDQMARPQRIEITPN